MKNIFRGNLYYADLDPCIGSEQNGIRPVVILQNNIGNRFSPTVLVAPITTKNIKARIPTHVIVPSFEDKSVDVLVLLEQTRAIDKTRLKAYLGKLSAEDILLIDKALIIALGINIKHLKNENSNAKI